MSFRRFELDIWPHLDPLLRTVQLFKVSSYQVGREVGWHYHEKPCIMSRKGIKFQAITIGQGPRRATLKTPYAVVFALEYRMYPAWDNRFLVSHRCGKGPLCIEPTHMHIASVGENNERRVCHELIKKEHKKRENKRTKAFREGTWFLEWCPHDPPCFVQWGKLKGNDRIWDPVSIDVAAWY